MHPLKIWLMFLIGLIAIIMTIEARGDPLENCEEFKDSPHVTNMTQRYYECVVGDKIIIVCTLTRIEQKYPLFYLIDYDGATDRAKEVFKDPEENGWSGDEVRIANNARFAVATKKKSRPLWIP